MQVIVESDRTKTYFILKITNNSNIIVKATNKEQKLPHDITDSLQSHQTRFIIISTLFTVCLTSKFKKMKTIRRT